MLRQIQGFALEWGYRYHHGTFITKLDASRQFQFMPHCFNRHLRTNPEIALTQDLDGRTVFARTGDGTLRIESNDFGLLVTADLADTPVNRKLCRLIDTGKVRGWSHRATDLRGTESREGGVSLQCIFQSQLLELTIVINKYPRAKTRQTPIFLAGGPQAKGLVHA